MDERVVRHAGRETSFRVANPEAPEETLVYVHGAGVDGRIWERHVELIDDHPAAIVDLSGHGRSSDIDATAGGETVTAYVSDLEAVLAEIGGAVVVGHDLGGAVTLECLSRGQAVAGAVLVGLGPRMPIQADMRRIAAEDLPGLIDLLHQPGRFFADPVCEDLDLTRTILDDTGQPAVRRDYETCHGLDIVDRTRDVDVPVRVVVGVHDRLTPPESNRKLAEELSRGSLTAVSGAAHLPMLERPEALEAVVSETITELGEIR